jgi:hypothetical protein
MEILETYQTNYEIFNIRDSYTNGENTIHILEISKLYGDIYISYVFESETQLYVDKVDKFITLKSNYPTKLINQLTTTHPCGSLNNE